MPSVRSQKSFCNESLRLRLVVEVNVDIQPALEAFKRKLEAVKGASPKDETRLESFLKAYNNSEDDNVCYAIVKSQTDSCRNCCNAREQQACLFIVRGTTEEARHKVLAARLGIYESDIGANLVVAIDGCSKCRQFKQACPHFPAKDARRRRPRPDRKVGDRVPQGQLGEVVAPPNPDGAPLDNHLGGMDLAPPALEAPQPLLAPVAEEPMGLINPHFDPPPIGYFPPPSPPTVALAEPLPVDFLPPPPPAPAKLPPPPAVGFYPPLAPLNGPLGGAPQDGLPVGFNGIQQLHFDGNDVPGLGQAQFHPWDFQVDQVQPWDLGAAAMVAHQPPPHQEEPIALLEFLNGFEIPEPAPASDPAPVPDPAPVQVPVAEAFDLGLWLACQDQGGHVW